MNKIYIEIAGNTVEAVYTDLPLDQVEILELDLDWPDIDGNPCLLTKSVVMGLDKLDPDVLVIERSKSLRRVRAAKKRLLGLT